MPARRATAQRHDARADDKDARRLQEPRPARRIAGDVAYFGTFAIGMLAIFEWMDFHVRGKSVLFGVNPRCVDYSSGYCFKLDTANLPWDAVAAAWHHQGIVLFGLGALFSALWRYRCF